MCEACEYGDEKRKPKYYRTSSGLCRKCSGSSVGYTTKRMLGNARAFVQGRTSCNAPATALIAVVAITDGHCEGGCPGPSRHARRVSKTGGGKRLELDARDRV